MNRVGAGGRGESVWMGFFLYYVLGAHDSRLRCARRAAPGRSPTASTRRGCERRSTAPAGTASGFAARFSTTARRWARPPASECQIDALVQAWAVLSGAGDADFARKGIAAVEQRLVRRRRRLIRLLDPPFDRMAHDPGYIKGYLPGDPRERRAVHARRAVVRPRGRRAGPRQPRGRAARHAQPDPSRPHAGGSRPSTRPSRTSSPPTCTASRRTSAAAGWTWYTGSAGWMFRVAVESILGLPRALGSGVCDQPVHIR